MRVSAKLSGASYPIHEITEWVLFGSAAFAWSHRFIASLWPSLSQPPFTLLPVPGTMTVVLSA